MKYYHCDIFIYSLYLNNEGAWATAVATYAQNINDINKFLCDIIPPENINPKILEQMDQECARKYASADMVEITLQILKERSVDSVADAWAAAIQVMYLGLYSICIRSCDEI